MFSETISGLKRRGLHMALSIVLDELDEALTKSSGVAAALGDEFLVYLIDMAILHVRKKAVHTEDRLAKRLRRVSSTHDGRRSEGSNKPVYAHLG